MSQKFVHHVTNVVRPEITLNPVTSGKIKGIGYDPETSTLAVQFVQGKGAVYHYPGVTADQYKEFAGAESVGKHFITNFQAAPFEKFVPAAESETTAD